MPRGRRRQEGGNVEVFVVDKTIAFGPADPGFLERVAACVKANKPLGVKDRYTALKESDQKTAVADDVRRLEQPVLLCRPRS